ncbi:MAG TPA: phage integrase SAM-like domain-containing protein, partial [Arachidicoccus soli]|nr:phage integrase SAM-like domain-containing protein [Arachidicoccus soli]
MKQNNVNISIVPDKRRVKEDETFPLKLRLTFRGVRKYYATGCDANLRDWQLIQEDNTRGKLKRKALTLLEIRLNAEKCCHSLANFSFAKFEAVFFPKTIAVINVRTAFEKYNHQLNENGQIGSAIVYKCACVSLHKFKPNLKFEHLTVEFLRSYEQWFISQNNSITTVGIYLRGLRAIVNYAIQEGLMDANDYPFGKRRYIIPSGRNIKKALKLEEIGKIYHCPLLENSNTQMCRDYWIFLYICNGMNVQDFCLLKYGNIMGDFIVFQRSKTIRSQRSNPEPISISLKDETKKIIDKWGQKPRHPDSYIFPCLKNGMSPIQIKMQVQLMVHLINEHMKKIA